jgi:ATP-dependent Zn protease
MNRNLVAKVLADDDAKRRVEQILHAQRDAASDVIRENMDVVHALRDALMERDELVGDEIGAVIVEALERRRLAKPHD